MDCFKQPAHVVHQVSKEEKREERIPATPSLAFVGGNGEKGSNSKSVKVATE